MFGNSPPRECRLAVSAAVLAVPSVQFDVPVTGPLVLEQPGTELASEGHLIRMRLQQ